jgi:hypothetical protein
MKTDALGSEHVARGTHDIRGGAVHLELAGRDPQQVTVMGLAPAEVRLEVLVYAVKVGSR